MNSVLEHAARLLDHQPTRTMEAEPLYRRSIRETGVRMPFQHFMSAVRERADYFAVIAPDPVLGIAAAWDPRQRLLYEAALEAAGLTHPLIVLTERLNDPTDMPAVKDGPCTAADVLGDAHESLTHLLHGSDPDDPLHAAVTIAFDELHQVKRALRT